MSKRIVIVLGIIIIFLIFVLWEFFRLKNKDKVVLSKWRTYRNEGIGFEFKYPEKNRFEPSREKGDASPVFCYLLEEGATPKSVEGTACIWTGYISQAQLNVMGITYCGAYPEDLRCESLMINQHLGFTIDWRLEVPGTNQMKASAWISHPGGGVVTLDLQPVVPKSKDLFKQILFTFNFIDKK